MGDRVIDDVEGSTPALIHVTHWKAGSQWILKVLKQCFPDRIVEPVPYQSQFLGSPVQRGKIYPTVYVTKPEFDSARCPPGTRHFVIIRDLRDTLASAYFSIKISHPLIAGEIVAWRSTLDRLSTEDGLIYLIENWLPYCSRIQQTWKDAGEPLLRYEDLLGNDVEMLEAILLTTPGLPVDRERLRQAIVANRFESLTGRALGTQELSAHERVGAPGDWRNHFTDRVKDVFKMRHGELLVATGYEPDLDW
jgi:lipopolysaccharide transport system ATP-binding protein